MNDAVYSSILTTACHALICRSQRTLVVQSGEFVNVRDRTVIED